MAIGTSPVASQAAAIHRPNARANAPGCELGEDPLERCRAGDAVVEPEEAAEEVGLGPPVLGDRLPRVGPADHGAGGDGQDVDEAVELVGRLPAGVGQVGEDGGDRQRRHGVGLLVPPV
jgi:hypothetical protein